MTYQIADARTRYFKDKQHYMNFRQAWSEAVNSENSKPTKDPEYGYKSPGWLTAAHMLLYALLRGQDIRKTFTPLTNENKLKDTCANRGAINAYDSLARLKSTYVPESSVIKFLAPFNETVDKETLLKVIEEMPEIRCEWQDDTDDPNENKG